MLSEIMPAPTSGCCYCSLNVFLCDLELEVVELLFTLGCPTEGAGALPMSL